MIDASALRLLLLAITGWFDRREREALAYLIEENRLLRRQLGGRRVRLTDDERPRLARRAYRLGRRALRDIATIVTPDTLCAGIGSWWRTNGRMRGGERAPAVHAEIRYLVTRMAEENPSYLHGHSELCRASSRHSGGPELPTGSDSDPGYGFADLIV